MVLSFLYRMVHRSFGFVRLHVDAFAEDADILVLRPQLAVLAYERAAR